MGRTRTRREACSSWEHGAGNEPWSWRGWAWATGKFGRPERFRYSRLDHAKHVSGQHCSCRSPSPPPVLTPRAISKGIEEKRPSPRSVESIHRPPSIMGNSGRGMYQVGNGFPSPSYCGRRVDFALKNEPCSSDKGSWTNVGGIPKKWSRTSLIGWHKIDLLCRYLLKMLVHSSSFAPEVWVLIWTYCPRAVCTEPVRLSKPCVLVTLPDWLAFIRITAGALQACLSRL